MNNGKVNDAVLAATIAHYEQLDKNGEPYILHPLRVMSNCWRDGFRKPIYLISAVLHDTVEDTPMTVDNIKDQFGLEISKIVDVLTKRESEKRFDYIDRVGNNRIATIIKLRDIEDNMNLTRLTTEYGLYSRYAKSYRTLQEALKYGGV